MNAISLFGAAPSPGICFQMMLGLTALILAAAPNQLQQSVLQARPIPVSLPLACLIGLAAGSVMAGIIQPELLAAALAEA